VLRPAAGEAAQDLLGLGGAQAPCVSVYCRSISTSVQCRSTPSIIAATSEAEQDLSWL
jgi:hypothetical protein